MILFLCLNGRHITFITGIKDIHAVALQCRISHSLKIGYAAISHTALHWGWIYLFVSAHDKGISTDFFKLISNIDQSRKAIMCGS